jgi:serine protease Do
MYSFRRATQLALAALLMACPTVKADPGIYQHVLGSCVWVVNTEEKCTGSGVLIDLENRLVLTNYHVVGEAGQTANFFAAYGPNGELVNDRDTYESNFMAMRDCGIASLGRVIARSEEQDLAIIQLDQLPDGAQALCLADKGTEPGEKVYSVGNPGASGSLWVYSPGEVRQVYRRAGLRGGKKPQNFDAFIIEMTSPISSGDSGSPLVNGKGELVGLNHAVKDASVAPLYSYAIDLREVKSFLNNLDRDPQGQLGAQPAGHQYQSMQPR